MNHEDYRATAPKSDKEFTHWLQDTATKARTATGSKKLMYLAALPMHDVCVYLNEIDVKALCRCAELELWTLADLAAYVRQHGSNRHFDDISRRYRLLQP